MGNVPGNGAQGSRENWEDVLRSGDATPLHTSIPNALAASPNGALHGEDGHDHHLTDFEVIDLQIINLEGAGGLFTSLQGGSEEDINGMEARVGTASRALERAHSGDIVDVPSFVGDCVDAGGEGVGHEGKRSSALVDGE